VLTVLYYLNLRANPPNSAWPDDNGENFGLVGHQDFREINEAEKRAAAALPPAAERSDDARQQMCAFLQEPISSELLTMHQYVSTHLNNTWV
jgi:hypothetical protein